MVSGWLSQVTPAPRPIWRELLAHDPSATTYQTPEWLDSLCRVDGWEDVSRLYTTRSGQQLVLPIVRRSHWASRLAIEESLPSYWGMGGLVAAEPVDDQALADVWGDILTRPTARIRVRESNLERGAPNVLKPAHRFGVTTYTEHIIDLRGGFERVWKERFKGSTRTGVRKAEQAGVVIESDSSGRLVPVFYDLYLRWVQRRAQEAGHPVALQLYRTRRREPFRKFAVIAEMLGNSCQVWVAWKKGQPLAAAVGLTHKSHAIYFRGYSDKAVAGPSCANDLLQRSMIEDACVRGCIDYSMGGSGEVPGLIAFKTRFGAVPKGFPVYTLESEAMRRFESWGDGLQQGLRHVLSSVFRTRA